MAHIAHIDSHHRSLGQVVAAPFVAVFNWLVALAEASPKYREMEHLSRMSDEQLAARGIRREDIVQKVLGTHFV